MSMPRTLTGPCREGARLASKPAAGADTAWSANERVERHLRRVGEAIADAVLGYPDRRRHDGRPAGHPDDVRSCCRKSSPMAAARRNRPAPPGPRSPLPASARSGTRPRSKPASIPAQEQSRLGTSLSKSLPLNEQYSLTLQQRLQSDPAGHRAGARHRQPSEPQLRNRPVGEAQHHRHRHQPHSRPDAVARPTTNGCARSAPSRNCSTASPSPARSARPPRARRTRASARASSAAGEAAAISGRQPIPRKIQHCRILAPMRSKSAALMASLTFVVRGTSALASPRNRGKPMTAIRSEKVESTEVEDSNLAAVSEVEAGIRDFVRNDVAYLRRPAPGMLSSSSETALEPSTEATVNNVNSLIQRVAGTSLDGNRKSDRRTGKPARPVARRRSARAARDFRICPAQPGRDEIHPHDRRQRHAVEARRGRPSQQLTISAASSKPPPPLTGVRRF